MRTSNVRLRHALAAVLSVAALPLGSALGAESENSTALEEVLVTGSRIRGAEPVGSNVVAVGRDDIDASSAVSTAQLIQEVPQVFNLGISENSRGQAGGSSNITYGTSINLRGIGPYSTLTMLDGHRAVPQGTSGFAIDPSIIPTLALERVEVVADGASAIYGSDAVAGVVNLILRRNFEGVEVSARAATASDYSERQIGAIGGYGWNSGHVTLSFENGYHTNLSGRDRDYFRGDLRARGGRDFRVAQCNPGNIVIPGATAGSTVSYAIPAGGVTAANRASLVAATTNLCDNAQTQDLIPEQDHNSAALTFDQSINDGISLFGDAFWARRAFTNYVAVPAAALTVRNGNPYFVAPPGSTVTSETVNYSFEGQLPQNHTEGYSLAYEGTIGTRIKLGGSWNFEALYTRGFDNDLSVSAEGINNAVLNAALARTDPATALNPFSTAPNNAAALAGIATALQYAPGYTNFHGWETKVDGSLFSLPGGEVRTAVGYEGQYLTNHAGQLTGTWAAPVNGLTPTRRRTVNSGYAELFVPIFGANNAVAGIRKLDLDLAIRYDNYSDIGSTTNPKYGLNWSPLDGLLFRSSYGESFRAPLFSQIYGNSSSLFVQNYSDPTIGGAIRQGITLSGGNLALEPETATTYSFGVDYEPTFIANAKFSLTYFHVEYEKQITSYLSDLTILNRESQFAGTTVIQRNPSATLVADLLSRYPVTGTLPNPVTLFVDGRTYNLGKSVTSGWDFQAKYRVDAGGLGNFAFGLNSTYFTMYKVAITSSATLVDQLNTIYNPLRFKARGSVGWSGHGLNAIAFVNYLNSYDNNLTTPVQVVESQTTVDLNVGYTFDGGFIDGLTVGLDAINLFDKEPPFVNIAQSPNGGGGFDPTASNPIGRLIGIRLSKKW